MLEGRRQDDLFCYIKKNNKNLHSPLLLITCRMVHAFTWVGLGWVGFAKNSFFFFGKNDLLKVILNQSMNNSLPKQLKYLQNNFVMESGDYMKSQLV